MAHPLPLIVMASVLTVWCLIGLSIHRFQSQVNSNETDAECGCRIPLKIHSCFQWIADLEFPRIHG